MTDDDDDDDDDGDDDDDDNDNGNNYDAERHVGDVFRTGCLVGLLDGLCVDCIVCVLIGRDSACVDQS